MSIIKHVTLQKIVAHDFRYVPRISNLYSNTVVCVSLKKGPLFFLFGKWHVCCQSVQSGALSNQIRELWERERDGQAIFFFRGKENKFWRKIIRGNSATIIHLVPSTIFNYWHIFQMHRWWEHGYIQGVSGMCCTYVFRMLIWNFNGGGFYHYFILVLVAKYFTGLEICNHFFYNYLISGVPFEERLLCIVGKMGVVCL